MNADPVKDLLSLGARVVVRKGKYAGREGKITRYSVDTETSDLSNFGGEVKVTIFYDVLLDNGEEATSLLGTQVRELNNSARFIKDE